MLSIIPRLSEDLFDRDDYNSPLRIIRTDISVSIKKEFYPAYYLVRGHSTSKILTHSVFVMPEDPGREFSTVTFHAALGGHRMSGSRSAPGCFFFEEG